MGRWSSDITSLPAHRPKTSHTAAAKLARPGSVPADSGARVPPLPGIGVSGTATAQRSKQYPGTKRTVKKRAAGATNGGEYDAMRSIGDKMPASSSALAALHRAMHAAENGAGKGTLPCRGAFAKTLARQGIVLTTAELTYVADSFGCGSAVSSMSSSRSSSRLGSSRQSGPRGSKVNVASLYPSMAGSASAPLLPDFAGPSTSDVLINYGAFIRHFMKS